MSRTLLEHSGLAPKFWPYAVKAACFGHNISGGEDSPYFKRHNKVFGGLRIPFGSIIDYYPSDVRKQRKRLVDNKMQKLSPVFAPVLLPGIFLGYHLLPGGKWGDSKHGDYKIGHFADFQQGLVPRVDRTKEVYFNKAKIAFPLKTAYDLVTRALPSNEGGAVEAPAGPQQIHNEASTPFDVPNEEGGEETLTEEQLEQRRADKRAYLLGPLEASTVDTTAALPSRSVG